MMTQKEIEDNMKGSEVKLKEHQSNYKKFGWQEGDRNFLNAEKTTTYMMGWINALKWVLERRK